MTYPDIRKQLPAVIEYSSLDVSSWSVALTTPTHEDVEFSRMEKLLSLSENSGGLSLTSLILISRKSVVVDFWLGRPRSWAVTFI